MLTVIFLFYSPPPNSEGGQPKTQATATQEELTQEERPCSAKISTSEADNNGQIHSVLPIIKSPSPDVYGHYPPAEPEPLGQKKTGLQRYSVRNTDNRAYIMAMILFYLGKNEDFWLKYRS